MCTNLVPGHQHHSASAQATASLARERLHAAAYPGGTDDELSSQNLDIALRKLIEAPGGLKLAAMAAAMPWSSPTASMAMPASTARVDGDGADRLGPQIVERLLRRESSAQRGGQGGSTSLWGLGAAVLDPLAAASSLFAQARAAAQQTQDQDVDSEELL